jgi:hypothetical protein
VLGAEYPNAILLDSMTIQGAVRLLTPTDRFPPYRWTDAEHRRGDKWNYPLNTGFRIACDLACLSQLVQSIILHDHVLVESSHSDIRLDSGYAEAYGAPLPIDRLQGLITPFKVSYSDRIDHMAHAAMQVLRYAESDAFRNYLSLLSTASLEAIFIHISHGYFETGYSDRALFPRDEIVGPTKGMGVIADGPEEQSAELEEKQSKYRQYESLLTDMTDNDNHPLARTPYSREDVSDKAFAAADVLRNAHAAYYYQSIADTEGVGYLAHPLRSSFVAFDIMATEHGLQFVGERMTEFLRESRVAATEPINKFLGKEIIHGEVPFFLAMILRDVTGPDDILERAWAIRESKDAEHMRAWVQRLSRMVSNNDLTVERLGQEVLQLKNLVDHWMSRSREAASASGPLNVGLNFGLVSLSKDLSLPPLAKWRRMPRHLRLFQSLAEVSNLTPRFDPLVKGVFGEAIGDSWDHYRYALAKFEGTEIRVKDSRYSPLSLFLDPSEYLSLKDSDNRWDRQRAELAKFQVMRQALRQIAELEDEQAKQAILKLLRKMPDAHTPDE